MAVLAAAAILGAADTSEAATRRVKLSAGMVAAVTDGLDIYLEAEPLRGEGMLAFARRLTGTTTLHEVIEEANRGSGGAGRPQRLLAGVRYKVPFAYLRPEVQLHVAAGLFASDRGVPEGWRHEVGSEGGRESLWRIAEWFTGRGDNYGAIRAANSLPDEDLRPGQTVIVPASLLRPAFRGALPPSSPYHLEYARDGRGDVAIYRLKAGEALYSSVVIRFTGQVFAEDVHALTREIAERSGIREVTDIPVGFEVKVPLELLAAEYLPAGHPRRLEYEQGLLASARFSNPVTASRLQGVTVILDAGHGGADVGASLAGVWESVHVYDIMVRAKRLLETTTSARVLATTMDGDDHVPLDRDRMPYSKSHRVLTTPNYPIEDSRVGVNLRWYLANSAFRQAVERDDDPAKVVFVSIHADSLHPSLRGAMVYVPGARYRGGSFGKSGTAYASRREVQERPRVSFSSSELVKSEGLSRELAQHVLRAFGERGLAIHPDRPVRDKIVRNRSSYVPAVLRYNATPAEILLEVCNLANEQDRGLVQTSAFRQRVAEAVVEGILGYYGERDAPGGTRVATTR